MRRSFRRHAALASMLLAIAAGVRPSGAQPADPTISIDRTGTAEGEEMLVTGGGWTQGATLIVELCGHGGLRGTIDCDVGHQRTAGVGPAGTFSVTLTSGRPPSPCPCVVRATDQASRLTATAPIAVAGVPTVPIADGAPAATAVEIRSIELVGDRAWTELFGAPARRTLEVTLVNVGSVPIDRPVVNVVWGAGADPDGFVPPPEVAGMDVGESATFTVPLERGALELGRHTAAVEVQGLGEAVTARASMSSTPWGLLGGALVLLQLALLRIRSRLRRRLHPLPETAVPAGGIDSTPRGLPAATAQADVTTPVVLDLDELAEATPVLTPGNGASSTGAIAGVAGPGEVRTGTDALLLELEARLALKRAISLSESLVAAAAARVVEMDEQAAARARAAAERHDASIKLLESAKARADELAAAAADAAAAALRGASADREAAHRSLAAADAHLQALAEAAGREVARALAPLQHRVSPATSPNAGALHQAPADDLDLRMASAMARAVASTRPDGSGD